MAPQSRTQLVNLLINLFYLPIAIARWAPVYFFLTISLVFYYHSFIDSILNKLRSMDHWIIIFALLFSFEFVKVFVHTLSFCLYIPIAVPKKPSVTAKDVTVIVSTVGDLDNEFEECIQSIVANEPAEIIVSTVGPDKLERAIQVCHRICPRIRCLAIDTPSKRKQVYHAVRAVATSIIVLADDHVFWKPEFFTGALAPFENRHIGGVATSKRVRRHSFSFSTTNFYNFIACIYLERHNFECTATTNLDGGCFVISGRTALYRACIFRSAEFEKEYLAETWLFGTVGYMNVDDDNMITRWLVKHGWGIHFQNCEQARIETTLGDPHKFLKQCDRWARTSWRSNSTSLFVDFAVWQSQPWCVYAVFLSSFVNFALFYDFALSLTLYHAVVDTAAAKMVALTWLVLILFASKMIKPLPHFWRYPADIVYLPGYILFGYFHSLVKLRALLTVTTIAWGSRPDVDMYSSSQSMEAADEVGESGSLGDIGSSASLDND